MGILDTIAAGGREGPGMAQKMQQYLQAAQMKRQMGDQQRMRGLLAQGASPMQIARQTGDLKSAGMLKDLMPTPPKAPTGYQYDSAGDLGFTPGGPSDPAVIRRSTVAKESAKKPVSISVSNILAGLEEGLNAYTASPEQINTATAQVKQNALAIRKSGVKSASLIEDIGKLQSQTYIKTKLVASAKIGARITALEGLLNKVGDWTPQEEQLAKVNLSQLAEAGIKAASEIESYNNLGTLIERTSGSIKKFFVGTRLQSQRDAIAETVATYRNNIFQPAKNEMSSTIRRLLETGDHSDKDITVGINAMFDSSVSSGTIGTKKKVVAQRILASGKKEVRYEDGSTEVLE